MGKWKTRVVRGSKEGITSISHSTARLKSKLSSINLGRLRQHRTKSGSTQALAEFVCDQTRPSLPNIASNVDVVVGEISNASQPTHHYSSSKVGASPTDIPNTATVSAASTATTGTSISIDDSTITSQSCKTPTTPGSFSTSEVIKLSERRTPVDLADKVHQPRSGNAATTQHGSITPTGKVTSLDSEEYDLQNVQRDPALYYSLSHWPEVHPSLGKKEFLLARLKRDLEMSIIPVCKKRHITLTKGFIVPDLRLAGRAKPDREDVELYTTVWIDCTSEMIRTLVRNALKEEHLRWIAGVPIEVQCALRFNSRTIQIEDLDLDEGVSFGRSYQIHVHVEEPEDDSSACGLILCTTITKNGALFDQWISRLGGLLQLDDDKIYASSTAHGIVNILQAIEEDIRIDEDLADNAAEKANLRHKHGSLDCISPTVSKTKIDICSASKGDEIEGIQQKVHSCQVTRWRSVPSPLIFDFIRAALPTAGQTLTFSTVSQPHDFSLFEMSDRLREKLENSYVDKSVRKFVEGYLKDEHLSSSLTEVIVLLGQDNNIQGKILPDASTMFMAGVEFITRRIILRCPLASGTSGSWVVYDGFLCGIIIASYEGERMAHMITAQRFLHDIETSLQQESFVRFPEVATDEFDDYFLELNGRASMIPECSTPTSGAPSTFSNPAENVIEPSIASSLMSSRSNLSEVFGNIPRMMEHYIAHKPDRATPTSEDSKHILVDETYFGRLIDCSGKLNIWSLTGRGSEISEEIGRHALEIIEQSHPLLSSSIATITLCLVGRSISSARLTLMISSSDKKWGKMLVSTVKESRLLERYPSLKVVYSLHTPGYKRLVAL